VKIRFVALLVCAALPFAGCAGVQFSELFDESAAAEGTGIQGSSLVRAVVILATHDATARQRAVAEQNARRAVAKMQADIAKSAPAPRPKSKPKAKPKTTSVAKRTEPKPKTKAAPGPEPRAKAKAQVAKVEPPPAPEPEPEPEPAPPPAPKKKLPRVIAVATEKDEKTAPGTKRAVMLFDTHAGQIIGNKVYDIEAEPSRGEEVRFETHAASYIGASL
jgi:outer membrane biosynthesis protein TonB